MNRMDHANTAGDERLEQLSAWLDGELSADEAAEVAAHVETCDECQRVLAELHAVRAVLHSLPAPTLPRSFELPDDVPLGTVDSPTSGHAEPPAPIPFPTMERAPLPESTRAPAAAEQGTVGAQGDGARLEEPAAFVGGDAGIGWTEVRDQSRWLRVARGAGALVAVLGLALLLSSVVFNQPVAQHAAGSATTNAPSNSSSYAPLLGAQATQTAQAMERMPAPHMQPFSSVSPPIFLIVGVALLVLGIILVVVGLVGRRRRRAAPPPAHAPPGA